MSIAFYKIKCLDVIFLKWFLRCIGNLFILYEFKAFNFWVHTFCLFWHLDKILSICLFTGKDFNLERCLRLSNRSTCVCLWLSHKDCWFLQLNRALLKPCISLHINSLLSNRTSLHADFRFTLQMKKVLAGRCFK